jgi:hypothetical protein
MALNAPRSDVYAPSNVKTFTLPVGASQSLHSVAAGALQNHLPASIALNVTTGGTFIFKDGTSTGTSNTVTLAAGWYVLPFTASTLEIGTAIGTATVAWSPEP